MPYMSKMEASTVAKAAVDKLPRGNLDPRRHDAPLRSLLASEPSIATPAANIDARIHYELMQLYHGQTAVRDLLDRLRPRVSSPVRQALALFRTRADERLSLVQRAFALIGHPPEARSSGAIEAIVMECDQAIRDFEPSDHLDEIIANLLTAAEECIAARRLRLLALGEQHRDNRLRSILTSQLGDLAQGSGAQASVA